METTNTCNRGKLDTLLQELFYSRGMSFIPGDLEAIYNKFKILKTNEIEFICMSVSSNIDFFKNTLSINSLTISNLLNYGIDAYLNTTTKCSRNRKLVTESFHQIMFRDK
jgi:hypothetical protein